MITVRRFLVSGMALMLGAWGLVAADPPVGPAYQIVLRSRNAEAIPHHCGEAQTAGGSIIVEQPEPNTIICTMAGAVAAGSDCHTSTAALLFKLEQELDIVALRPTARPPRVGLLGRVIGTLQVSDPGCWCGKTGGTADQGPGTASLCVGGTNLVAISVKPSGVACGEELAVNYKDGPVEAVGVVGGGVLVGSFRIGANQGKCLWHRQAAVADFDPAPQLDAFWADILKPFRAVPRRDFGFKVVLRVIEDSAAEPVPAR
jgi:hypothetical protein